MNDTVPDAESESVANVEQLVATLARADASAAAVRDALAAAESLLLRRSPAAALPLADAALHAVAQRQARAQPLPAALADAAQRLARRVLAAVDAGGARATVDAAQRARVQQRAGRASRAGADAQTRAALERARLGACAWPACARADELRACGRCRRVRYCGSAHQRLHWPQHKLFCSPK